MLTQRKSRQNNHKNYIGLKLWQKMILSTIALICITLGIAYINPIFDFDMSKILSSSTTLFSILVGFFIASAMSNFLRLKTLISSETGGLFSVYKFADLIDGTLGEEVKEAIDKYIITGFDWELEDYVENTQKEFEKIYDILKKKKSLPDNDKEQQALDFLMNDLGNLPGIRNEISMVAKTTLNSLYWILLITLAALTIFAVLMGTQFTFVSILLAVCISAAVLFALFLLDEIDKNRLNENDIAFRNFNQLLITLGRLPYYLEEDIKTNRVKVDYTKPYRLCKMNNDSAEREIIVVNP